MQTHLSKILEILSTDNRRQLYWLVAVMLAMGTLEIAGIGSIMPFIAAVANIDTVLENRYAHYVYELFGFDSTRDFVMALGVLVLSLLVARHLFFALANWLIFRFTFGWRQQLSERLMRKYLIQPYGYFLSKNTIDLKRKVSVEIERLVSRIIVPGIQALTSAVISAFIVALLIAIDPLVAVVVAASLGGSYLLFYTLVYRKLARLSHKAGESRRMQFKTASEVFEGIKELKLFGKEAVYIEDYAVWARRYAALETTSRAISQLPRYGIEVLATAVVMGFVLYLLATGQDLAPWMPILVVYLVGGYRLLPALQRLFGGLTAIQYELPTLDAVHADLTGLPETRAGQPGTDGSQAFGPIETIALGGIDFRYPDSTDYAIRGLGLTIEKDTTVGLIGPTGSGKTTLVDIILGLLEPQSGVLAVNGVAVTPANVHGWQKHIGYVPQHIFLFDDTLARNVAYGVPDCGIDRQALENALKTAHLYDFAMTLPDGLDSTIGQRGIRLSGGQRQRIGIARAIYRNPDILVLDEATNALDGVTEGVVMEAIQELSHKLTIIMIAHRLNTVRSCDVIHYVDNGRIVSSGTYADLEGSCEYFRKMASG